MDTILLEKSPAPGKLEVLNVDAWPLKKFPVGEHFQHHKLSEKCYIVAGKVKLVAEDQKSLTAWQGDLFIISADSKVRWCVIEAIEYHYYQTPLVNI